nr:MAG TPA: hypothetical protein [Caudoviricetes sp.]
MGARARRESVARGFLADPSPGSESLGAALGNRGPSLVRDFFPTENFGRRALRKRSVDRKLLRERSGKRKGAAKMQREVPACFPLFDRGGHEFPPTPRPSNREGRGMRRSAAGGGESD